jgi:ABC-type multidrug transport system permease subunit
MATLKMSATDPVSRRYRPLVELTVSRVKEFWREPAAVFWVYAFPLIMMVALGLAFRNRPVEQVAVDVARGHHAEQIAAALRKDPRFRVDLCEADECRRRLRIGRSDLLIMTGPGGREYVYHYDPTKPASVLAWQLADDVLQRAAGREDVVSSSRQEVTEPGGRYIDFLVPGLVGMGLLGGGLWGVGFAIVDLRIRKLLKRFLATPMRPRQLLGSIMLSRLLFTIPEVLVLLVFARSVFGVRNFGSDWLLLLLIILGAFEFAGIGLLVASRAQTLETVSGLMNLVMLPLWIGSGIFFPVERFPDELQPFLAALPLTPLISAMRAVMLEGAALADVVPQIAIISAWGAVTFVLALRRFRWVS